MKKIDEEKDLYENCAEPISAGEFDTEEEARKARSLLIQASWE